MLQDLCFGFGVSLFPLGFFWWLYLVLIFLFFGSTIVKNGWKMILLFFQGFWKSKVKIKLILCYSCTVWCMYCASFHSLFSVRLSFLFFFFFVDFDDLHLHSGFLLFCSWRMCWLHTWEGQGVICLIWFLDLMEISIS